MSSDNSSRRLIIISGPSGVGKTTIVRRLLAECRLPLKLSVSATTRDRREGEVEGVNYHYLDDAEFKRRLENGDFLEAVEVFGRGHWYGTLKEAVSTGLNAGNWIILEIDVEGAAKVIESYPDAITIFIHPGSLEELERRLRGRGSEEESALRRRLEVAERELGAVGRYEHVIENRTVDQTVIDICQLLEKAEIELNV